MFDLKYANHNVLLLSITKKSLFILKYQYLVILTARLSPFTGSGNALLNVCKVSRRNSTRLSAACSSSPNAFSRPGLPQNKRQN